MSDAFAELPAEVREELDQLLALSIDAAAPVLVSRGKVLPFAFAQPPQGKASLLLTGLEDQDAPEPAASRELIREMLRRQARAGTLHAAAVIYDSLTLRPDSDANPKALCIHLEHAAGHAVDAFVPFRKGWLGIRITNQLVSEKATPRIFAAGTDSTDLPAPDGEPA